MKILEELDDLQSKVRQIRSVEKLAEQGFQYDIKELSESITNSIKDVSEDVTGTMMESSKENNKTLATSNKKLLEILNDSGLIASYLLSPLSKITNPEKISRFI